MMVVVVVMMIIINITSSSSIKLVPMRFRGVQTPSLKSGWWQSAPSVEGCIPSVRMEGKSQGLLLRSFFVDCYDYYIILVHCYHRHMYIYIYIYDFGHYQETNIVSTKPKLWTRWHLHHSPSDLWLRAYSRATHRGSRSRKASAGSKPCWSDMMTTVQAMFFLGGYLVIITTVGITWELMVIWCISSGTHSKKEKRPTMVSKLTTWCTWQMRCFAKWFANGKMTPELMTWVMNI